ncbi:T9SS type A sorting domain-containing protein [Flavobacterium sp.]|uniref:DUF7619 domain-containing protein n=1 Tax=Flavobacterium sp. TaxID=239 RepID=UPI001B525023|nr:T9SS type A sorting domain-containing protein [Flavobacterium sp.]MBP6126645.1 T9SS type A sorting domain-containing protein [Flavobacterium sp.]
MNKIYIFLAVFITFVTQAQIVNIPDANFKAKLLQASSSNQIASSQTPVYSPNDDTWYISSYNAIDTNGDGEIQVSEAQAIKWLSVSSSSISNLTGIEAFTNLQVLHCQSNQLSSLNLSGLTNLKQLSCQQNQLSSLNVSGCTNLQTFSCYNNLLTSLNVSGLTNLKNLNCIYNLLTSLNVSGLTNLIKLYCNNNQLPILIVSGLTNLQYLYCNNNQLPNLNVSGCTNLKHLFCEYNLLTSLNVSGLTNLISLDCSYNQLTSLFIKNVNWAVLGFSNNPNLQYICADEEDLGVVQNKINQSGMGSTCHVNSYCSFTPGGTFYTVNGNTRFDSDNNGCESSDAVYSNLKINISNGTQTGSLIANGTGNYSIPVQAGTHTLTPLLENPSYFNVSPATTTLVFPLQTSPFTQNFCITPNGVHHDVEVTLFPLNPARPGFDANYKIVYKNKGTSIASGAVVFDFDDCHQITDYVIATPTPNAVAYNGLTFNYTNLQTFESREIFVTLNVNSPMETPAVNAGDYLSINATISCTNTDENLTNNAFNIRQIVVNSYDPNDKTCLEGSIINPSKIGDYLTYQIRFENTGTFPAQNIVVKDMIDTAKFDVSTLQIINSSHTCYAKITGNKVEFIFENINLPFADATNDGYVVFKIKSLPTLTVNSTVSNSASIYFDYNFPIITNTATSTYQLLNASSFVFENEFVLYPNPVKDNFTIKTKNSLEIQSLEIYNTLGQIVLAIPRFSENVDVSSLQKGTYLVKVNTEKGNSGVTIIKE